MAQRASLNEDATYLRLNETLVTKLQSTKKTGALAEITSRIGSLSTPSKMPGYAWSLSASKCLVGSLFAKIPGTACSLCYARKGRYVFPNVQAAHSTRYRGWVKDCDWVGLMAIAIHLSTPLSDPYFRWFDSGDLQSAKMFDDICEIARLTPHINYWLPTQERKFIDLSKCPPNLTVRVSAVKLNPEQVTTIFPNSSSVGSSTENKEVYVCPSRLQGNQCMQCRACWQRSHPHVRYIVH